MKKALLSFQLVFAILFLVAFISSWFVIEKIKESAKDQVTEKVVSSATVNVGLAEEVLHSKAAMKYLAEHQREALLDEINQFKLDPASYVRAITLDHSQTTIIPPDLQSDNPLKNALLQKIFGWKQGLKAYFNKTFSRLVLDIRIFLLSNVVALLMAALICYKQAALGRDSLVVSTILTVVVAISAFSYLSQNWFFTILINSYAGYAYIGGILATTAWLYYEYYTSKNEKA